MIKVNLPNLKFKKQRVGQIEKIEAFPEPGFNSVEWAKQGNGTFGPNYMIQGNGLMIQVLPEDKVGTSDTGELVADNVLSIFVADTDKARERLEAYKEWWGRKDTPSGADERSEDAKVANKHQNKKGKKG